MPGQGNRLSYPCSTSTRNAKGKLFHQHRGAYINAIHTERGEKRMYVKIKDPVLGEKIIWLNAAVVDKMIDFLVNQSGREMRNLSKKEQELLYGRSWKDRK